MSRAIRLALTIFYCMWVLLNSYGGVLAQNDTGTSSPPPIDLNGLWMDNGRVVQITQSGSQVAAMYLEPYVCDHRDGTSSETDLDLEATITTNVLEGETSTCHWDTDNPGASGIVRSLMTLTVSEDGNTMQGTWYNATYDTDEDLSLSRVRCRLTVFNGDNFTGDQVVSDLLFVEMLKRIDQYAADNNVRVHVTSSFRTSTNVPGAIVDPATSSNHLVGHGIDMNVWYKNAKDKDTLCNSTCLGGDDLPAAVSNFLDDIRSDTDLRWGGDFNDPDPVHIDDGLNLNDPDAWETIYDEVQADPACFQEAP